MYEDQVTIRNKNTGAETTLPLSAWTIAAKNPLWARLFIVVRQIKVPPEVVALLKAQKAAKSNRQ